MNLAEMLDKRQRDVDNGPWFPGTGEEPFFARNGIRLLYCWQPSTGKKRTSTWVATSS